MPGELTNKIRHASAAVSDLGPADRTERRDFVGSSRKLTGILMLPGPRSSAEVELSSYSHFMDFRAASAGPTVQRALQRLAQMLFERRRTLSSLLPLVAMLVLAFSPTSRAQTAQSSANSVAPPTQPETTEDYNRRLEQLNQSLAARPASGEQAEYRIGSHDLLEINVFEAPDLNRSLRVSASGEISMPLLGAIQSTGLTARELEGVIEIKLRQYMKDPHVGVFVTTVESHPVSVVGAVKKPGVFQVRGTKTVLEMLSMAEGLSDDAGDQVLVMRGAGLQFGSDSTSTRDPSNSNPNSDAPASPVSNDTVKINLKDLLESGDQRYNVPVYPGDIVKVTRGGIVYVIGEVKKPGGFVLKSDQNMSVLKAIALAEGLTSTSAKSRTKIIRTDEHSGQRVEVPIDLGKVLAGKAPDTPLKPADIVFVPNSSGKTVLYKGTEAAVATASGLAIWRF